MHLASLLNIKKDSKRLRKVTKKLCVYEKQVIKEFLIFDI